MSLVRNRKRKPVEVVVCPSAFPNFESFTSSINPRKKYNKNGVPDKSSFVNPKFKSSSVDIDFDEAVKEVHSLGYGQLTGKLKRQYEADQSKDFTGLKSKKQTQSVKVARLIKKAAVKREARREIEVKESGVIIASKRKGESNKKSHSEKNRWETRVHGPSPSIGFMKKGVFRVKQTR